MKENLTLKTASRMTPTLAAEIRALHAACNTMEAVTLKMELDFKLAVSETQPDDGTVSEVLVYDGDRLAGYGGICCFGLAGADLEVTGMVHPVYRRQGIATAILEEIIRLWKCRGGRLLLLCDRESFSGQAFLRQRGALYHVSEFEMFLKKPWPAISETLPEGVTFRKATNADAGAIARQDAVYFGSSEDEVAGMHILPEEEARRGMTIWLMEKDGVPAGKVNVQRNSSQGGIFGLGVLPPYRGSGLGRVVLQFAVRQLIKGGADEIYLQVAAKNATALGLYTRTGFEPTSTMDYFLTDTGAGIN